MKNLASEIELLRRVALMLRALAGTGPPDQGPTKCGTKHISDLQIAEGAKHT